MHERKRGVKSTGWLCSLVDFSLDAVDVVYVDVRCKFHKYVFLCTYEGAFSDICV